jgi:asparagine synthase (glutamine-hydrolysing)
MPGIVGLITKMPRQQAETELLRMVEAIHHETFYETGTWIDESMGVFVGWALRKGCFADGMPLRNEQGDVTLVFSGEEYPSPDTARRLRERGHAVAAEGPSYLVHLYEEDPAFPAGLNGVFHGLIVDRAKAAVILFNDRCGMHRICYHESRDAFYFGVEAKAILAVRPELRNADPKSFGELVTCSCVLEDRTVFKGIRVLPAGSAWIFRNGSMADRRTYFQPRQWEEQVPLDKETYYHELRTVLLRNLPRYFNGPERVGMAVTGGLDTRVLLACNPPSAGSISCYTFGGMYRDSQDVRLARQIAGLCGQPHEVIEVGDEFLREFPRYAERSVYLTEGGADVSRASDLYLSEKARQIAPVKVVGTYGSEILRHAVMFKPMAPQDDLFHQELLDSIDEAQKTYARIREEHPVTFAAFRQTPWYHHGILALETSQLTVRSPFLDRDFLRTVFRKPQSVPSREDIRLRLISDRNPALAQIRSDRGIGGNADPLSSAIRRALLEFTFKAEYAYDYGMPHWLTRIDRLLSALRPAQLFLGRHKLLHYRVWYRDALSNYVRQMLLDPRTLSRPYLKRRMVETIVNEHVSGQRNYTTAIHKLLTMELIQRLFFDPA